MELIIGKTRLKCYEDGQIKSFRHKPNKLTLEKGVYKGGYLHIIIEQKWYMYHHIIFKAFNPDYDMDSLLMIVHINSDFNDNHLENLRLVTHQNTSAKGYRPWRKGFMAQIMVNDERYRKYFKTEYEATEWHLAQTLLLHDI